MQSSTPFSHDDRIVSYQSGDTQIASTSLRPRNKPEEYLLKLVLSQESFQENQGSLPTVLDNLSECRPPFKTLFWSFINENNQFVVINLSSEMLAKLYRCASKKMQARLVENSKSVNENQPFENKLFELASYLFGDTPPSWQIFTEIIINNRLESPFFDLTDDFLLLLRHTGTSAQREAFWNFSIEQEAENQLNWIIHNCERWYKFAPSRIKSILFDELFAEFETCFDPEIYLEPNLYYEILDRYNQLLNGVFLNTPEYDRFKSIDPALQSSQGLGRAAFGGLVSSYYSAQSNQHLQSEIVTVSDSTNNSSTSTPIAIADPDTQHSAIMKEIKLDDLSQLDLKGLCGFISTAFTNNPDQTNRDSNIEKIRSFADKLIATYINALKEHLTRDMTKDDKTFIYTQADFAAFLKLLKLIGKDAPFIAAIYARWYHHIIPFQPRPGINPDKKYNYILSWQEMLELYGQEPAAYEYLLKIFDIKEALKQAPWNPHSAELPNDCFNGAMKFVQQCLTNSGLRELKDFALNLLQQAIESASFKSLCDFISTYFTNSNSSDKQNNQAILKYVSEALIARYQAQLFSKQAKNFSYTQQDFIEFLKLLKFIGKDAESIANIYIKCRLYVIPSQPRPVINPDKKYNSILSWQEMLELFGQEPAAYQYLLKTREMHAVLYQAPWKNEGLGNGFDGVMQLIKFCRSNDALRELKAFALVLLQQAIENASLESLCNFVSIQFSENNDVDDNLIILAHVSAALIEYYQISLELNTTEDFNYTSQHLVDYLKLLKHIGKDAKFIAEIYIKLQSIIIPSMPIQDHSSKQSMLSWAEMNTLFGEDPAACTNLLKVPAIRKAFQQPKQKRTDIDNFSKVFESSFLLPLLEDLPEEHQTEIRKNILRQFRADTVAGLVTLIGLIHRYQLAETLLPDLIMQTSPALLGKYLCYTRRSADQANNQLTTPEQIAMYCPPEIRLVQYLAYLAAMDATTSLTPYDASHASTATVLMDYPDAVSAASGWEGSTMSMGQP